MMTRLPFTLLLIASALPVAADPPMTKIRVEVRKATNDKPVDRASVVVRFVEGRSVVKLGKKIMTSYQMRTNQDGVASMPSIPQGKIQIQVIAKGFQTFGQIFDIGEEEKTVEVKLNDPQPQFSVHQ
ncbi:MAG: carboxypeptidase-like regulatory domain-containing protein [Bryobacteraceae bacterium]